MVITLKLINPNKKYYINFIYTEYNFKTIKIPIAGSKTVLVYFSGYRSLIIAYYLFFVI